MSALAYLDIGDDNGGIVLNLSEEGLGLQAVAPLDGQKNVRLRIQLPQLDTRIETAGEIVWLGGSNRQAGVRFISLPAVARNQIREWIKSQPSPGTSSEGMETLLTPAQVEKPINPPSIAPEADRQTLPPRTAPPEADPRTGKWLSLMAEFQADLGTQVNAKPEPSLATQVNAKREPNLPHEAGVNPPAVLPHSRPEIVFRRFADRAQRTPSESPRETTNTPENTIAEATAAATATAPDLPIAPPQATSSEPMPSEPMPSTPPLEPANGLSRVADAGVVASSGVVDSIRQAASASQGRRARNQAIAVAAFALFSILCFAIGTRVGRLATGQVPSPPAPAPPTAPSVPTLEVTAEASLPAHAVESGMRAEKPAVSVSRRKGARQLATASAPAAPVAAREGQPTMSLERRTGNNALMPGTPPTQSLSDAGARSSAPLAQGAALVPSGDTTTDSPSARVVDGYTLQPSDRFNPCHLTYRVDPVYPPEAQQQGIEGTVKIHLVIAADGSIQSEKLISGPPELVPAAMEAAKYWRYFPALLNGEAIPAEKDIEIPFHLAR